METWHLKWCASCPIRSILELISHSRVPVAHKLEGKSDLICQSGSYKTSNATAWIAVDMVTYSTPNNPKSGYTVYSFPSSVVTELRLEGFRKLPAVAEVGFILTQV